MGQPSPGCPEQLLPRQNTIHRAAELPQLARVLPALKVHASDLNCSGR